MEGKTETQLRESQVMRETKILIGGRGLRTRDRQRKRQKRCERDAHGERKRQEERHTYTDRTRERHTQRKRQTVRQTDRERERERGTQRERESERERRRETEQFINSANTIYRSAQGPCQSRRPSQEAAPSPRRAVFSKLELPALTGRAVSLYWLYIAKHHTCARETSVTLLNIYR